MNNQRFVIFGMRRTGSTLLATLLNSHPQIRCHSELFYQGRWNVIARRPFKSFAFRYPLLYLNWISVTAFRPVVGFKLMVHQNEEMNNLLYRLTERNWQVISIRRRNAIQRVLSEAVLFATRIPHSYGKSQQRKETIHIDTEHFRRLLEQDRRLSEREAALLAPIPHIDLTYEDDFANPQHWSQATERVLSFLNLPIVPLNTSMVKTWEKPYEQFIANYAELMEIARVYTA